jgi:hypothetical protein
MSILVSVHLLNLSLKCIAIQTLSHHNRDPSSKHVLLPLGLVLDELFGVIGEAVVHRLLERGLTLLATRLGSRLLFGRGRILRSRRRVLPLIRGDRGGLAYKLLVLFRV